MADSAPLLAREIMVPDPFAVAPEATIEEAAGLMGAHNIGALVVCDERRVVGIWSERDLVHLAAADTRDWNSTPIAASMTANPITVAAEAPWETALELMNTHRIRHLPVVHDDELVGMLSMRDLAQQHAAQLERLVSDRTAELAQSNQQLRASKEAAGLLQRRLLPSETPSLPPFEFAVLHLPYDHVSGDYYDFIPLGEGRLGVLIADAAGHGLSSAFISVMAKTAFQAYGTATLSPAQALETINDRMEGLLEVEQFVTKLYAVVDQGTRRLTYALAGHPPPIWYRRQTGKADLLDDGGGTMLGIMEDLSTEEHTIQLEPGDSLLLYTDGAMECANEARDQFGTDGLCAFMTEHGMLDSVSLLNKLQGALDEFRGERPLDDDLTCIVMTLLEV